MAATEVINAKQLWLSDKSIKTLDAMLHFNPERRREILPFEIEILYDELCTRIKKFYPCFREIGVGCENFKEQFMALSFSEKVKHIKKMLTVTHANSSRVDNWDIKDSNGNTVKIKGSRMSGRTLKPGKIVFIDSSITGMHSRRYTVGL